MKTILGGLLVLVAVFLGLYLGLWVMFIGGIVQIVKAAQADPISGIGIGIGLLRVTCASFVGWLTFLIGTLAGGMLIESDG